MGKEKKRHIKHSSNFSQRKISHCLPLQLSPLLRVNQNCDLNNMKTKKKMLLLMCLRKVLERAVHQFVQNIGGFLLV